MSERCILALDQGTTSSRAIVFGRDGLPLASAAREFQQHYPVPGWVEHDPRDLLATQLATATSALESAGIRAREVAAVGITNQRETTVVWDRKTGEPVHPAIVWQDRRTADFCASLKDAGREEMVVAKTGLRLDPYFSATKLRWILEEVDGARARAEAGELAFGTVDSWLLWNLTAGTAHATDASNASRTLLYNIREGEWDDELLELFGIPRSLLPEVRSSSEVYGEIAGEGPLAGIPVAGIAGDQQAALFGQACFEPGLAKNTYGTGCFLLMNTGEQPVTSHNNLLSTVAWRIGERTEYALEGSVFIGGAVVQWLRDEMGMIDSAAQCDDLAESVADSGGLFLVPAFAGLGAPHWDPYARGAAFGMTRGTGKAHFARAALEAIAHQCSDLVECMEADSGIALRELRVDGGASRSRPLLQIQADLLARKVLRPKVVETTALGAAYLAGLAVGFWESREEIADQWTLDATFEPVAGAGEVEAMRAGWAKALERSKGWVDS